MTIYSSDAELAKLRDILRSCCRLPLSDGTVPGALLEAVLAHIRGAQVLRTYDYVDVVDRAKRVGWSVKSTMAGTPMTWKRAKIPDKQKLIAESRTSKKSVQALGDAILDFCNDHAAKSLKDYKLDAIGYARLVVLPSGEARYFERELCNRQSPCIFNTGDFEWSWSTEKAAGKKEQLSALHGWHKPSGERWWAWHGLGENQLHFTGERVWWPQDDSAHSTSFRLPPADDKLSFDALLALLENA